MQRALDDDPVAAKELTERFVRIPRLFAIRRMPQGAAEREELEQDSLLALWSKLGRYDGSRSLEAWAYGFVAIQHLKSLERRYREAGRVQPLEFDPERLEEPMAEEDYGPLHDSISTLRPTQAIILRMVHFDECNLREVAGKLDLPHSTVKTKYYRGLARLKERLVGYWASRQG